MEKNHFGKEEMQRTVESQEKEFKRREKIIVQKFQRQIQAYENGLISERDLCIARERVEAERKLLEEQKKRAADFSAFEIENKIKNEAKQLHWLWENGELPLI